MDPFQPFGLTLQRKAVSSKREFEPRLKAKGSSTALVGDQFSQKTEIRAEVDLNPSKRFNSPLIARQFLQ